MSNKNETFGKTLFVVISLCLVCSLVVSTAAVGLKPKQIENRALDRQRNILRVAGLLEPGTDIGQVYRERIVAKVVDLETGNIVEGKDGDAYDQRKAAKDPGISIRLSGADDPAGIKRRANHANIYYSTNESGGIESIILPIHGYGLWSTMYAFLAVSPDGNTLQSLVYYDQGETPGLGAEIENPRWAGQFEGKQLFDSEWKPALTIVKGGANPASSNFSHEVDGLSGATLTANGVQGTFDFWIGDMGFGPFLVNLRNGDLNNG